MNSHHTNISTLAVEPVAVFAASTRAGSLNRALATMISERLRRRGAEVDLVDLDDYDLPLFNGDFEAEWGVPGAAVDLVERLDSAATIVMVSPEYNGSFPPLLKNTIDWMTRVDTKVLAARLIVLASASPGAGGGRNGLDMVRQWMCNMSVEVAPELITVSSASIGVDGSLSGVGLDRIGTIDQFARGWHELERAAS